MVLLLATSMVGGVMSEVITPQVRRHLGEVAAAPSVHGITG
jgi:hypothetical protein